MVAIPDHIRQLLRDYVTSVENDFRVRKVILFGSYAKGRYRRGSDIDLAVFSDHFAGMKFVDVVSLLLSKARKYKVDLEAVGFTYEEFLNSQDNDFIEGIKKEGVEIYSEGSFSI